MLSQFQLRNGLKVILYHTTKSPVVTVQAWVKTGSADEQKGEEGISHFIEHLLFKGTQKYKVGEIAAIVEGSGGELNAYTSFDQTVFHVTISKHYLETALDTVSQMMGYPEFDGQEIDNEREVVIEEIRRSNDSPHRESSRLLFSTVYEKHPYGKPVIGFEQNIRDFSRKQILNYYHRRYSPKNMYLVLVGDFDQKQIHEQIKHNFEKIPKYPVKVVRRPNEPKQKMAKAAVKEAKFQETMINFAWRVPTATHADIPALDLMAVILGQGDSSRLVRRLRLESPLCNYVSTYTYTPQDEGFFTISTGLNTSTVEEFMTGLGDELSQFLLEGPTDDELQKAMAVFEGDEFFSMETVDGLARKLGSFEQLFKKPDYYKKYFEKLSQTTASDILKVARKYIRAENLVATAVCNENKEKVEQAINEFNFGMNFVVEAVKSEPIKKSKIAKKKPLIFHKNNQNKSEVMKFDLPGGGRLLMMENHEVPTFSLKVGFLGGQRIEPEGEEGLSELMSSTWTSGTKAYSEAELMMLLESNAISLRPFSGRNSTGISLGCLSQKIELGTEKLFEVLTQPRFDKNVVDRERMIMLENHKQKKDNPAYVAIQNFQSLMFKDHPYGRDASGTDESLQKINHEGVKSLWSQVVNSSNVTIAVAGDFEAAKTKEQIFEFVKSFKTGQRLDKKRPLKPIERSQHSYEKLEKEQSHLVYGVRGLAIGDSRRWAQQVLQSILAGQGGRLFIELRDKNSLAYSVSPIVSEGLEGGFFGAYIGCAPDKVEKALSMIKDEFKKISSIRASEDEVARAKRYLIGRHDIGLQKNSAVASAYLFEEIYGQPLENITHFSDKIGSVSAEDVRSLAEELFEGPGITALVGPRDFK